MMDDWLANLCTRVVSGNMQHFGYESLCGLLVARGYSEIDAQHIVDYIVADRETVLIYRLARRYPDAFNFPPQPPPAYGSFTRD